MSTTAPAPRSASTTERLHVNWIACDGRGLCIELLPELLERDEWGYPKSRTGTGDPVVPSRLAEHARRAVADCPKLALSLLQG